MKSSFDIVALAKRINLRREELNRLHPGRPVRITPAMSRILENDPEYRPFRERHVSKKAPPVRNPTAGTLVEIAGRLGTTVGDLLGEPVPLARPRAPTDPKKPAPRMTMPRAILDEERPSLGDENESDEVGWPSIAIEVPPAWKCHVREASPPAPCLGRVPSAAVRIAFCSGDPPLAGGPHGAAHDQSAFPRTRKR